MAELTKGEIFREAQETIKPIANEVEGQKKKFIENAAEIISFSAIALSIILYAFNTGYCKVFNLPADVMSLDMTRLLPLAAQILSIASFILLYVSSLKADRALNRNRFNLVRIIWGFFIVSYFFSVNNVHAVIGSWMNLLLICLLPLLAEILIYWAKKPQKVKKIAEAEHQAILEDTVQDSIFATYYIRYGIFLIVLPLVFAPNLGEFSARAEREYQTCVVQDITYAVVGDYEDKVLVQRAIDQDGSLQIDTSNYAYFDKKDIVLRYVKYDSVKIVSNDEMAQSTAKNEISIKIKEVLSMPSITDWLMVIITFVYVIATILICIFNGRSAKATREQVAESKRQFDETRQLQVMPYLQVEITQGELTEEGEPPSPYTFFVISDAEQNNQVTSSKRITFKNVGLGMLHHTKITWNSLSKKDDGYPAVDIVIPPQVEWGINAWLTAKKPEVDDPLKPQVARCSLKVEYDDLLGNRYWQQINFAFLVYVSYISLLHYHITAPSQLTEKETNNA